MICPKLDPSLFLANGSISHLSLNIEVVHSNQQLFKNELQVDLIIN